MRSELWENVCVGLININLDATDYSCHQVNYIFVVSHFHTFCFSHCCLSFVEL